MTVDDDCAYAPNTVESFVRRMPPDRGAVGGICQEPRGRAGRGDWRRLDQAWGYKHMKLHFKIMVGGYKRTD